jgi:hypothetical protein
LVEEVARLKGAATVLLVIDVVVLVGSLTLTFASFGPTSLDELAAPFLLFVSLCASITTVVALVGCIGILLRPSSPSWRRAAFVGSLPITVLLIATLLFVTFLAEPEPGGDYVAYVMVVLATAGAVWSTYVFWPTVEVRPA